MKRKNISINYWELLACVVVITGAFQIVSYYIFQNRFVDDTYGIIRLLIILGFISFHYRSVLSSSFFKSFSSVLGTFAIYLSVVFILFNGLKMINPEMVNTYIADKVEKTMENSASEMAAKGYAVNEGISREVIEESIRINQSIEVSVKGLLFKLIFTVLLSLLIAWLAKNENYKSNVHY